MAAAKKPPAPRQPEPAERSDPPADAADLAPGTGEVLPGHPAAQPAPTPTGAGDPVEETAQQVQAMIDGAGQAPPPAPAADPPGVMFVCTGPHNRGAGPECGQPVDPASDEACPRCGHGESRPTREYWALQAGLQAAAYVPAVHPTVAKLSDPGAYRALVASGGRGGDLSGDLMPVPGHIPDPRLALARELAQRERETPGAIAEQERRDRLAAEQERLAVTEQRKAVIRAAVEEQMTKAFAELDKAGATQ